MFEKIDKKKGGEKMKNVKIVILVLVGMFCSMVWSTPAFSTAVLQPGIDNGIFFKNVENWVDVDSNGFVSVNDLFYGILSAQNIDVPPTFGTTIWNADNTAPGVDSFSGYFLNRVTSIIAPGVEGSFAHINIGAAASDPNGVLTASDLASGVVLKMYTDSGTAFETNGSVADDITKATDGSLWASFTTAGGYWYTHAPIVPPGFGSIGESFGGLNFVTNNTGLPFEKVNDPLEAESFIAGIPPGLFVDIYFSSELEDFGSNPSGWRFGSNDPAVMHPVPEPTSMLLFGMGVFGLVAKKLRKIKIA